MNATSYPIPACKLQTHLKRCFEVHTNLPIFPEPRKPRFPGLYSHNTEWNNFFQAFWNQCPPPVTIIAGLWRRQCSQPRWKDWIRFPKYWCVSVVFSRQLRILVPVILTHNLFFLFQDIKVYASPNHAKGLIFLLIKSNYTRGEYLSTTQSPT